jgi:hypothetical protein
MFYELVPGIGLCLVAWNSKFLLIVIFYFSIYDREQEILCV